MNSFATIDLIRELLKIDLKAHNCTRNVIKNMFDHFVSLQVSWSHFRVILGIHTSNSIYSGMKILRPQRGTIKCTIIISMCEAAYGIGAKAYL